MQQCSTVRYGAVRCGTVQYMRAEVYCRRRRVISACVCACVWVGVGGGGHHAAVEQRAEGGRASAELPRPVVLAAGVALAGSGEWLWQGRCLV